MAAASSGVCDMKKDQRARFDSIFDADFQRHVGVRGSA